MRNAAELANLPPRTWIYRPLVTKLLPIFSGMTLVIILLEILVLYFPPSEGTFNAGPISTILFALMMLLAVLALGSQLGLWIAMLSYAICYSTDTIPRRIGCVIVQLFTLSVGSALVYWMSYRPALQKTLKSISIRE